MTDQTTTPETVTVTVEAPDRPASVASVDDVLATIACRSRRVELRVPETARFPDGCVELRMLWRAVSDGRERVAAVTLDRWSAEALVESLQAILAGERPPERHRHVAAPRATREGV